MEEPRNTAARLQFAEISAALAKSDARFLELFRRGDVSVELYAPRGEDLQTPHAQDELYIVASGSGVFHRNGDRMTFAAGDLLFVPARMPHRFVEFTADFATWVVFFGARQD